MASEQVGGASAGVGGVTWRRHLVGGRLGRRGGALPVTVVVTKVVVVVLVVLVVAALPCLRPVAGEAGAGGRGLLLLVAAR